MPRPSIRRDALYDLRECLKWAILFRIIHDSDSESDSEYDMEIDKAQGEMDGAVGYQIPEFGFGPFESFPFDRFLWSDLLSSDGLDPICMDGFSSTPFDRFSFEGLYEVATENHLDPIQEVEQEMYEDFDLDSWGTSDSDSEGEEVMNLIGFMHAAVTDTRYLQDRFRVPKSVDFRYSYFQSLPDDDFRVITRLSREIFLFVVSLIEADPIFVNNSPFQQAPVHWQAACALDRLGNDGQGVSFARSKLIWGLGHGTVMLYYRRVVFALCNLRNTFITWPDSEERQRISAEMEGLGFKDAVGFVDGTTFPLYVKPSMNGHSYFDRKRRYSVHGQIVCDNKYLIRHLQTGMPGSCHDSGVFSHSPMVSNPELFFSDGQYIISDSAYAASPYVVPAYRIGAIDLVDDPQEKANIERFNTFLSKARIINEHTIGILKSRWTSLCSLRTVLRKPGDILKVIQHVVACAVLHNIAMERDPWEDQDEVEPLPTVNEGAHQAQEQGRRRNTTGMRKRLAVRNACLAYHDSQDA